VSVIGLRTADDTGDGPVQVTVNPNPPVTDVLSGNPNTSGGSSPTIVWDAHSPPTVTALSGNPDATSDTTIQYLVTFPPLAPSTQLSTNDFSATPSTVNSVVSWPCLPGALPGYQCFKVSVSVSGSLSSPAQVSLSVNDGTAGNVLDKSGLPTPASLTPGMVTWTNGPLTIVPHTTQGSGNVTFTGTAVPGVGYTVSVNLCADYQCSSPQPIPGPAIMIQPDGSWASSPVTAASNTYWALVTQTQAGNTNVVMTGPFLT
jgi:hypothetical protein